MGAQEQPHYQSKSLAAKARMAASKLVENFSANGSDLELILEELRDWEEQLQALDIDFEGLEP